MDILLGSVQTRQKDKVVFYVAKTLMIALNVLKKCVLNATKLGTKPESVKRLKIFNVLNATQLATKKRDVWSNGLNQRREEWGCWDVFSVKNLDI